MAILNRNNRFSDLIKAIKGSSINNESKKILIDYVNDVKNNKRNNDFFEDEFLERIFLEILTNIQENDEIFNLSDIIKCIKFIFPFGMETEDYNLLKSMVITNLHNHNNLFNKKLFSLFDNKRDYLEIINIILGNKEYITNYERIIEYALAVAPYCQNQFVLKDEIISFIGEIERCSSLSTLKEERLIEAKKRVGVYAIDEKTLALISAEAIKAQSLIEKLENLQERVNNHQQEVEAATKKGIDELQSFIDREKDLLIKKLDEYLLEIEKQLRENSDKVFKQILIDAQTKINEVKLMAASLSSQATDEMLRVHKTIQDYVQNDQQVKKLIQEAGGEVRIKEILASLPNLQVTSSSAPSEAGSGIYIPGNDRIVIPMNGRVELPSEIDTRIIAPFDESIPFDERMKFVLDRMNERKAKGEIFHEMTEEVVRCVMEGDWVYLWGPSGCGKSYVIKQVASLLGIPLVENGKITDKYSIMAYNDPHGRFRATQAFVALVYGRMLSLDEFDNGNTDTQVVLNELYSGLLDVLENPERKRFVTFAEDMSVPINPNFRMISAGNTDGNGENEQWSSRGKIDESVQERMTPKRFHYDNQVEKIIFGSYSEWYDLFIKFREVCDNYAKRMNIDSAPGIVTTRDAAAIAKYIRHNSKTLDQVLREKFIQIKDDNYLNFIMSSLKKMYSLDGVEDVPTIGLGDYSSEMLAKKLVYSCDRAIQNGRR